MQAYHACKVHIRILAMIWKRIHLVCKTLEIIASRQILYRSGVMLGGLCNDGLDSLCGRKVVNTSLAHAQLCLWLFRLPGRDFCGQGMLSWMPLVAMALTACGWLELWGGAASCMPLISRCTSAG